MKVLALILVAFLSQQARPGTTSTIRGVVLRSGTTTPVDKAIVELHPNKDAEPRAVTTSSNGRFEFLNVPPGFYQLNASRSGYLNTSLGQRGVSGSGRDLKVEPGTTVDNLELSMTATGAISGRVFDDTGEPLANVTVEALKYSYADGERTLATVGSDTTNDLGEFRLFWLPPGQYHLSAIPEGNGNDHTLTFLKGKGGIKMLAGSGFTEAVFFELDGASAGVKLDRASPGVKSDRALVPVYYPGTPDPQFATTVEVRSGADVRGIDFRLTRVATRKVRGTLMDSLTGQPSASGSVSLIPRSPSGARFANHSSHSENGTFEFTSVRPGAYFVVANANIGSEDGNDRVIGGSTPIEIGESDLNSVVVTLQRAVDIEGAITLEGPATLPTEVHPLLALVRPQRSEHYAEYMDDINTRFRIPNVLEGDYRLRWESSNELPPGVYLKSVSFGPVDALNNSIHIDQRTRDRLEVVLGANAGGVTGTVVDRERKPAAGVRVVLIPDAAPRQRNDLYQNTFSDESGNFRFERIPPGSYSLFAWEDIEDGLWRDAEFLRRHAGSGKSLHIVEGGRGTVEVVVVPSVL